MSALRSVARMRLIRIAMVLAMALGLALPATRLTAQSTAQTGRSDGSDTLRARYGLFGGYSANVHSADFRTLPGVPGCCPGFQSGSGGGMMIGALYEIPISTRLLLGLRASYAQHDATLSSREPVYLIVDGTGRNGAFEHSMKSTLSTIGLEPSIAVGVAGNLFVSAGVRGGMYIAQRYEQEERIADPPDGGTFLDANGNDSRSRVRNQSSGDLPDGASMLLQATIGIGFELPLNRRGTLLLVPEISYAHALNDIVSGFDWKPHGVRAGVAVKLSPAPTPLAYDTVLIRDTVTRRSASIAVASVALQRRTVEQETIEMPDSIVVRTTIRESFLRELPVPPPPVCTVSVTGVDDDGREEPIATLRIEEFMSTVAHPLLNYVFFEPGSSIIPDRYAKLGPDGADTFTVDGLYGAGTLAVYRTMLNVIGGRLREHPKATLTLTGCNMDTREEKENLDLSRARAEAVRAYLTDIWKIDPGRMRIDAVNLPVKRSNPLTPDGQAEDRRVEIATDTPEILDVLVSGDTARTSAPPIVRIRPSVTAAQGAASWKVSIAQHGVVLKDLSGSGAPPATIDWDPLGDRDRVPRFNDPIAITMEVTDAAGEVAQCGATIPTRVVTLREKREQRIGDYTIDRYNLILFNVGEAGITQANRRITDMISRRLRPESEVTIEGFADRTGSATSNQQLSARRAEAAAQTLNRPDAVTRGIGEARLLHPNDTPEGRFYCRTVQITVKTPIAR